MNPEIKALWVDALRSGEYAQTDGRLRRTYRSDAGDFPAEYCCLGVLCDLYGKATGERWNDEDDTFMGSSTFPSKAAADWAGMSADERIGEFVSARECRDVVSMNDTGSSFEEIADVIERLG